MRRLLVIAALAACVALVLLLRRDGTPPRAPPLRGLLEGETLRDAPEAAEELPGREPTILTGHVYGPDGRPVEKAEVRVVHPKTYTLVRTGGNGAYELPFDRSGRFLVEAALTIELAPERAWAEVPEQGDPAPLDFRLKPAGAIFGEVTLAGVPVLDAGVELYVIDIFGDAELVHDTSARNGYFNFYFDPPRDVPLRLDVKSDEGILRSALPLMWRGDQLNVGRIDLVPYPSLRIRMRLPDGSYAQEVCTCRPEDVHRNGLWHDGGVPPTWEFVPVRFLGTGSRVAIQDEKDVTMRLVFVGVEKPQGEEEPRTYMVERDVDLAFGRVRELDLIVRPGPFAVTSRLVDGRGRGVHARLRVGDREAATFDDGTFQIAVPHGGLHTVRLVAFDVPGFGWVDLGSESPAHTLLLDADDSSEALEFDAGGRVLLLATPPSGVRIDADSPADPDRFAGDESWSFYAQQEKQPGAYFSPRLRPGSYQWSRETGSRVEGSVQITPDRVSVVDIR